jgi:hypothetical protein
VQSQVANTRAQESWKLQERLFDGSLRRIIANSSKIHRNSEISNSEFCKWKTKENVLDAPNLPNYSDHELCGPSEMGDSNLALL